MVSPVVCEAGALRVFHLAAVLAAGLALEVSVAGHQALGTGQALLEVDSFSIVFVI